MKQMSAAGTRPILVAADVSDAEQVARMYTELEAEYGGIDILINNAGIQIAEDTYRLTSPTSTKCLRSTCAGRSYAPGGLSNPGSTPGALAASSTSPACTRSSRNRGSWAIRYPRAGCKTSLTRSP
jgi:NAD(P)-dependent dehydrogenase (short-subunit alcohol dehydrogenase family)